MSENEFKYFHRRAAEERAAAERATDGVARRMHMELADSYDEVARAVASGKSPEDSVHIRLHAPMPRGSSAA